MVVVDKNIVSRQYSIRELKDAIALVMSIMIRQELITPAWVPFVMSKGELNLIYI
jgi:hypothetical protein